MPARKPINTAPKDGRSVRIFWTDIDGQQNESIGRYRSVERLRKAGGDWDDGDEGWWVFTDGKTQKKVEPDAWASGDDVEDE